MITYQIEGELMTSEDYMARHGVSYLRALHEINALLNKAVIQSAARAGGLGTPARTAGDTGDATDEHDFQRDRVGTCHRSPRTGGKSP